MTREHLIKHWDVITAFKNGSLIQFKDLTGVWNDCEHPTFSESIEFRIKPTQTKRLPTIEEVEKWFLDNKVFVYKVKTIYHRMGSFDKCNRNRETLQIGNIWKTREEFCEQYTHIDGSELYITEQ